MDYMYMYHMFHIHPVFCEEDTLGTLKSMRPDWARSMTKYIVLDFDSIKLAKETEDRTFADYRTQILENRRSIKASADSRNTASYYLFCMSRYELLLRAIQTNCFKSSHFAWINICIERMGYKNLVHIADVVGCNRDRFSTIYIDYIPPSMLSNLDVFFQWGRCGMCSGFFTGDRQHMKRVCKLIQEQFLQYLALGYGHADEQLYNAVYFAHPSLFEHYYGDYQQMITNYCSIVENPRTTTVHFVQNALRHGNYEKCRESVMAVLKHDGLAVDDRKNLVRILMECNEKITPSSP